jgi:hypothetical protein
MALVKFYRSKLIVLLLATVILAVSCSLSSGLFVSGGNTPSFEIRRNYFAEVRVFPIFIVRQLHLDNEKLPPIQEDDSKNRVLWKIAFNPKNATTNSSEEIQRIEYGKVPAGFIQELPSQGSPEQLQENQIYEAVGPLSLMSSGSLQNSQWQRR